MKHLVTGSSGYVGSEIVKKLFSMGEDVIGIDIIEDLEISKKCNFFQVDISNYDDLKSIPELKFVKCVHHNAAMVPLTRSIKNFYKSNVEGTKNILKICHMFNINHLSHMSSSAIFGSLDKNNNVDYTKYMPTGEYGKSKYLAEIEGL
jgi:UDP-glucuronate 4-epimerase